MLFPAVAREVFLSSPSLKMRLLTNCNIVQLLFDLLVFRYFDSEISHSQTIRYFGVAQSIMVITSLRGVFATFINRAAVSF
jgi:hypothetical protein